MFSKSHLFPNTSRLLWVFCPALLLLFSGATLQSAVHDLTPKPARNERELIIKFRKSANAREKAGVLRNASKVAQVSVRPGLRAAAAQPGAAGTLTRLQVAEGLEVDAELARLQNNPAVEFVEPNYSITLLGTGNEPVIPNDFEFAKMYSLQNLGGANAKTNADISAPEAWAITTGNKSVIVAVIDTGIDYLHDDLKENIWTNAREIPFNGIDEDGNGFVDDHYGYDFVWNDSDPFDDHQHGTHVAGTIGAKGNNGVGTVGVCWDVSLMALKAFDEQGNGTVTDAIAAITYAVENGARVINASWGLAERSRALEEAAEFAADSGVLIVAAAGNSRSDVPSYPASFESVVSVGATDANDARADFSNYGPSVDVAAPGANILSTLPENGYGFLSGTSMAAPHVSGMAALVISRFPMYSRQELFDIVINSFDAMPFDLPIGHGRINASRAVQMDQPLPTAQLFVAETVSGQVEVRGTAAGTFFAGYSLNIGSGSSPASWVQVASSLNAVTNALLGRFDSAMVKDGSAVVQLVVSNGNGAAAVATAPVRVFNGLITFPLSADILAPRKYTVRGTVHGAGKNYELFYGAGISPRNWTKIATGGSGRIDTALGEWDATNLTNGYYALRLVIQDHGVKSEFTAPLIFIERKLKIGWPIYLEADPDFPATEWRHVRPADLNDDGRSEVVLVDAGTRSREQTLRVYSYDGLELWTRNLGFDIPPDYATIGDVNGDGKKEIFVDGTNGIVAFRHDGSLLPGWPVVTENSNHAKVLADLDGDEVPELIAYAQEYAATQVAETRELSVFNRDGALLRKWLLPWCGFTNDVQKIFPVVANLDEDSALEIVAASGCSELIAYDLESENPKWVAPVTGKLLSSPLVGDIDGDGSPEIIAAVCARNFGEAAGVYVFNRFGQRRLGWPVLEEFSFITSPALGDLDDDGHLEIVLIDDALPARMHVVQSDGFEAEGWPIEIFRNTSSRVGISIADINDDGRPEIISSVAGFIGQTLNNPKPEFVGGIVARDITGRIVPLNNDSFVPSIPFESSGRVQFHKAAPVAITDLDGNGRLDFVFASVQDRTYGSLPKLKWRSSLYAWELPSTGLVEWGMFGNDIANRGTYSLPLFPAPVPTNITQAIRDRVMTVEDHELQIHATTNDWNATSSPLRVIAFTSPTNGTVTLSSDSVISYRPGTNFSGMDGFTYILRDANGTTSSAPVIVNVKSQNDRPSASNIVVTMNKNSSVDIFYNGRDPEDQQLSFRNVSPPANGELWNYPSIGTYYPRPGFHGVDSFTYVSNDGRLDSLPANVTITVLNSNNPPKAVAQQLLTKTNRAISIFPGGSDLDRDPLTFEIVRSPQLGAATETGSTFNYVPPKDFIGSDSFTFRTFDGTAYSEEATISIDVIATNATPVAREGTISVQPDSESALKLLGADPDGDEIQFEVLTQPLHAELTGTPPDLLYLPRPGYLGPDRFEFRVSDGFATSAPAIFNIQVARQNRAPVAVDQVVAAEQNKITSFDLFASDPDRDPVQVVILKGPRNGLIYGHGTNITYAPKSSVLGADSFTYKLWDGQRFGNVGHVTVNISVSGELKPPTFTSIESTDGIVDLNLSVSQNRPLRIEASTNLVDWAVLVPTTLPTKTTFQVQDTNAPATMRYYRAVRE